MGVVAVEEEVSELGVAVVFVEVLVVAALELPLVDRSEMVVLAGAIT